MKIADLKKLAAEGAATRLAKMQKEISAMFKDFPEAFATRTCPQIVRIGAKSAEPRNDSTEVVRRKGRRPLTRKEKKALSIRMKKMWAEKRAKKNG